MKKIIKMALLLCAAAMPMISCSDKVESDNGVEVNDLVIAFDKNVIQSDGSDNVTMTVFYKGADVTAESLLCLVEGEDVTVLDNNKFSISVAGEYHFQAAYQTSTSDVITINAIDKSVPAAPADPQSGSTSFVKRAFLNQYTGAACPNCPVMVKMLRDAFFEVVDGEPVMLSEWKDKIVLASIRNYSGEIGFANTGTPPGGWPYLQLDYSESYSVNAAAGAKGLQNRVNALTANPAKVGISAGVNYYEDENQIVTLVTVKAAEAGEYNVGLWLMQDNYYKKQSDNYGIIGNDESYHIHENCVRIADSKYLNSHVGYPLGRLEKGETASWIFVMNVDEDWFKKSGGSIEDIHLAAFVTTPVKTSRGMTYPVVNAIDIPYNESVAFDYAE